jgi:hypothetical protein
MADLQLCQTSRAPERHSSSSMIIARHENLNSCFSLAAVEEYEPAEASQKGEGWPYAPEGWPKPGDKWIWKVGRRKHAKGYWQDRYFLLPKRLQKGRRKIWFWSKKSIEEYVKNEFPGTDLDSFFGSFQWRVPYATDTPTPTPTQGNTFFIYIILTILSSRQISSAFTPHSINRPFVSVLLFRKGYDCVVFFTYLLRTYCSMSGDGLK